MILSELGKIPPINLFWWIATTLGMPISFWFMSLILEANLDQPFLFLDGVLGSCSFLASIYCWFSMIPSFIKGRRRLVLLDELVQWQFDVNLDPTDYDYTFRYYTLVVDLFYINLYLRKWEKAESYLALISKETAVEVEWTGRVRYNEVVDPNKMHRILREKQKASHIFGSFNFDDEYDAGEVQRLSEKHGLSWGR